MNFNSYIHVFILQGYTKRKCFYERKFVQRMAENL